MSSKSLDGLAQIIATVLERQGYQVPQSVVLQALAACPRLSISGNAPSTAKPKQGIPFRDRLRSGVASAEGLGECPDIAPDQPDGVLSGPIRAGRWAVPAAIMDEEEVYVRRFDATGYFEQASDEALRALAAKDFRYSDEADRVSDWAESYSPEVRQLYEYLMARTQPDARISSGFAVEVSWSAAVAWIRKHRPQLADAVAAEEPRSLMPGILTREGQYLDAFECPRSD